MTDPESIWGPDQQQDLIKPVAVTDITATALEIPEKKRKIGQVTDFDINNDPEKKLTNPTLPASNYPIFNQGYKPGRIELQRVPKGGRIRFLSQPYYNPDEGVHDWHVEVLDPDGNPLGGGFISTWNRKGSIITSKKLGRRLIVFRPKFIAI